MRIDPKTSIGGVPVLEARNFVRRAGDEFTPEFAERILGRSRAGSLILALLAAGYIERTESHGEVVYARTDEGGAFARALASKPVSRATGQRALRDLLERCKIVAEDPEFLYKVRRITLFGSMLGKSDTVGDVDIVVELVAKEEDPKRHRAQCAMQADEAEFEGRTFATFLDRLFFSQFRVLKFLKSRSRVLQFTSASDPILVNAQTRVVYEDPRALRGG